MCQIMLEAMKPGFKICEIYDSKDYTLFQRIRCLLETKWEQRLSVTTKTIVTNVSVACQVTVTDKLTGEFLVRMAEVRQNESQKPVTAAYVEAIVAAVTSFCQISVKPIPEEPQQTPVPQAASEKSANAKAAPIRQPQKPPVKANAPEQQSVMAQQAKGTPGSGSIPSGQHTPDVAAAVLTDDTVLAFGTFKGKKYGEVKNTYGFKKFLSQLHEIRNLRFTDPEWEAQVKALMALPVQWH